MENEEPNNQKELYNWNPQKNESPYLYGSQSLKYIYTPFQFKILDFEEEEDFKKKALNAQKQKGVVLIYYELWDLQLIENIEVSFMLRPLFNHFAEGKFEDSYFQNRNDAETWIDTERPLEIYIEYPFAVPILLRVFPLEVSDYNSTRKVFSYGYISWQIGKLYAELYKNYAEEVGVYGHGLSDLQLGALEVYEDNKIETSINS